MGDSYSISLLADIAIGLSDPDIRRALEQSARVLVRGARMKAVAVRVRGDKSGEIAAGAGPGADELLERCPDLGEGGAASPDIDWDAPSGLVKVPVSGGKIAGWLLAAVSPVAAAAGARRSTSDPEFRDLLVQVQRLLENRLQSHAASLEEGAVMLTDVLGVLSHDLRFSLSCIKGYVTLLHEGAPLSDQERAESLEAILDECLHLERLAATLLERGADDDAFRVSKEPVLLGPLLRAICDDEAFSSRSHRIVVGISDDSRELLADPQQLGRVFRNLIDNAVNYSPAGSTIVVQAKRSGREVVVSVADQGYGIAPGHLNRLFERFFRVRNEATKHVRGTGLGLPITRRIVEAHGGHIWAESSVGSGSTFYVSFPADGSNQDEEGSGGS